MCWFTQPDARELALPCCLKFENLTWPKPNKINHVFLSIMMLCVDNTPSRIVCVHFHSSIITHPAHIFHFYNFPSISLYLPLPFPNSLLFHSCFPADILFIIPYTLHLFQTLNSPFSSSELLFCLKFLSITNAFWVERAGVRGCPYEALLVPAQSPGICWLMSNPTRALWSFLTSLHPLCTHTHSPQSFVSTQKYSVSASTWVLVVIGRSTAHIFDTICPRLHRDTQPLVCFTENKKFNPLRRCRDCIHYRWFTWDGGWLFHNGPPWQIVSIISTEKHTISQARLRSTIHSVRGPDEKCCHLGMFKFPGENLSLYDHSVG